MSSNTRQPENTGIGRVMRIWLISLVTIEAVILTGLLISGRFIIPG